LVDYNLQDARLVMELLDRTGLIELAVERSLLTGMQLDRVSAAIASVDSLYLNALRQRGVVAPSVGTEEREARIGGGYVMESKPGLYENVLVFDFKSLYPSIIRTFNIDPLTHVRRPEPDTATVRAPNGAHFRRDVPGIIPALLTQLAAEREQAKRSGQSVKANAIKILMNSFYGVLGAGASRLFSPDVANAVTSFGQDLIRYAADFAAAQGLEVLYGDTDSLFIYPSEPDAARALQLGERLCVAIGAAVAERVRTEFGCASHLELEFEKLYRRFFLPEVRGGKVGSKKRYAGLLVEDGREDIEFVGLESVRRDWSEVSKRFQRALMQRVFHDQPVEDFIRGFIADLRAGTFDDQLTYKKAIRKDIDAYTKTTPPHVKAARKLGTPSGRIIAYVMTLNGPEPVGELTAAPDYAHYIEHQIAPIADAVLRFLGTDFDAVAQTKKQLALF
jgi:DNA polymerase-2